MSKKIIRSSIIMLCFLSSYVFAKTTTIQVINNCSDKVNFNYLSTYGNIYSSQNIKGEKCQDQKSITIGSKSSKEFSGNIDCAYSLYAYPKNGLFGPITRFTATKQKYKVTFQEGEKGCAATVN